MWETVTRLFNTPAIRGSFVKSSSGGSPSTRSVRKTVALTVAEFFFSSIKFIPFASFKFPPWMEAFSRVFVVFASTEYGLSFPKGVGANKFDGLRSLYSKISSALHLQVIKQKMESFISYTYYILPSSWACGHQCARWRQVSCNHVVKDVPQASAASIVLCLSSRRTPQYIQSLSMCCAQFSLQSPYFLTAKLRQLRNDRPPLRPVDSYR